MVFLALSYSIVFPVKSPAITGPPPPSPAGEGFPLEAFPVFFLVSLLPQARAKARAISCVNNLKQIGLAVALYTQDYDDYYPTYYLKNDEWGGNVPRMAWMVRSNNLPWKVYRCPSSGKASPFTGNNWGEIQNSNTYTWNYSTYGYQQENHDNAPIKLTTLMNLCNNGETPVMVADGPDTPSTTITWDSMNIFQGWNVLCREDSETAYYATSRRHDGRCNVLLPDYSVTNLTKGAFDENYGSHKSRYFRPFLHATLGWLGCKE